MAATEADNSTLDYDALPPLYQDRAFWGMSITQFLGAFNDNVFKQIVLFLSMSVLLAGVSEPQDRQFLANGVFALPFVLFSGIAGYCSDRVRKKYLIVGCKVAEIVVMLAAVVTFLTMPSPELGKHVRNFGDVSVENDIYFMPGVPWLLLAVLFLMGMQSAWFGPAKYGILPEMVRGSDLPRFNGVIQMTTFVAIVLGIWLGGWLLDRLRDSLVTAGMCCVGIAVIGTVTSLFVRSTPVAQRQGKFRSSDFASGAETWRILREDRTLGRALVVYSAFWFVAALLPMTINWLGVFQFQKNYETTSLMLAGSSVGIAAGFVVAGRMSHKQVRFGLVRIGAWGLVTCLVLASLPAGMPASGADFGPSVTGNGGTRTTPADAASIAALSRAALSRADDGTRIFSEDVEVDVWPHLLGYQGSRVLFVVMGFFTGLFALPVQVYLQSKPPRHLKGRVIGSMNLVTWFAILLAAGCFFGADVMLAKLQLPKYFIFGLAALVLLPIAMLYRPADVEL
ncbi:MAG: MFS transporter [Planctomycetota bacterium]|nr:MAG: MFS transporter [Planctomycetota bacterium]REK30184.1 MAG: MFS transporter [Planctomycetota bacterium]